MLWDAFLALVALALAALGWVNAASAPVWFVLAGACGILLVLRWQRARLGRGFATLGVRLGGREALAPFVPAADSSPSKPDATVRAEAERRRQESRATVRSVRASLLEAMTMAENDREHGVQSAQDAAILAANQAAIVVHELDDGEARALVGSWKVSFDAIPKGWKEGSLVDLFSDEREPVGYPEPAWTNLRRTADVAAARLGKVLRDMA